MQASAKTAIARGRRAEERGARGGFATLYQKELADHFRSARFKLLFVLLTLTSLASQMCIRDRSRRARQIHLQEAKIVSDFYSIRAIFAFVGFVSALGASQTGGAQDVDKVNRLAER